MMGFRFLAAATAMVSAAACSSGGSSTDAEKPIDVEVEGLAVASSTQTTLAALGGLATVPGTGGGGAGATTSTGAAFSYAYGQQPGIQPLTGEPPSGNIGQELLVGQANFAVDTREYGGNLPLSGSIFLSGPFQFDHVTGIGPQEDGTFSASETTTTSGDVRIEVDFDTLSFDGTGRDETNQTVLTMAGQVDTGGAMVGTVVAAGMEAELEGIVVGDPKQLSGAAGGFAGSTETELLIGGFAAEGNEP